MAKLILLLFCALSAFGTSRARAQVAVPTIPFAMSQSVKNGAIYFEIPVVPGKYFYLTDVSITGNGGELTSTPPAQRWVLIKYAKMSPRGDEVGPVSIDLINPPGPSEQVDFHRAFPSPWQSAVAGAAVEITIDTFGEGNAGIAARVIGFYR